MSLNKSRLFLKKMKTQQHPDFCYTIEEGKKHVRQSNNERYTYFHQNHYTTGDIEQFLNQLQNLERDNVRNERLIEKNLTWEMDVPQQSLSLQDVFQTFQYIEKFKKGCFLQVHENHLKTFLPFSKQHYRNDWGNLLKIDPEFGTDIFQMMTVISANEKSSFDCKKIHRNTYSWYGNNGLVRFEYPLSENDNGYNILHDMFETLVKERNVPDVDFFLLKRDFPILKKNRSEPYDAFFGPNRPLLSHHYDKYVPILSMNGNDSFEDISIPTWEDWRRVSYWHDKRLFAKDYYTYPTVEELQSIPWSTRRPTAVWRGSSTGRGATVNDNIRLFVHTLSKLQKRDVDGELFLDAEISKWNLRPRKHPKNMYLTSISQKDFDFQKGTFLSPLQQCQYKYILHLPGHTCAYRLSLELYSGSVLLFYPFEYQLWFTHHLKPWVHYVPLNENCNEEELFSKIKWCKEHDSECQMIAKNALEFAQKHLSRDAILDYLQNLFCNIAKKSPIQYQTENLHQVQLERGLAKINAHVHSQTSISEEFYHRQIWISNPYYLTYYFAHLSPAQLEVFLQHARLQENLVNNKRTKVHLYEYQGIEWIEKKTIISSKRDDVNQLLIGYYFMNPISETFPYFMKTLFHTFSPHTTSVFLEHVQGETLDKLIVAQTISFDELIMIWCQLAFALDAAQDYCGFMHMDMYPWNIMIQRTPTVVHFPKHRMKLSFPLRPVLLDYGNSHVSDNGFHYYNTTPFFFNRSVDIISIIITSLDMFLNKRTLEHHETKKLFTIMKYVRQSFTNPEREFHSMNQIKGFLKQNKHFSSMLFNSKLLQSKSPMKFVRYLFDMKLISKDTFFFPLLMPTSPVKSIHVPVFYRHYYHQLDFFKRIVEKDMILDYDFCILFRQFFLKFKKEVDLLYFANPIEKAYNSFIIHDFVHLCGVTLDDIQLQMNRHVWDNHRYSDLVHYFLEKYPIDNSFHEESKKICETYQSTRLSIPFSKLHSCPIFEKTQETVPLVFFHALSYMKLLNPYDDYFSSSCQTLEKEIKN